MPACRLACLYSRGFGRFLIQVRDKYEFSPSRRKQGCGGTSHLVQTKVSHPCPTPERKIFPLRGPKQGCPGVPMGRNPGRKRGCPGVSHGRKRVCPTLKTCPINSYMSRTCSLG